MGDQEESDAFFLTLYNDQSSEGATTENHYYAGDTTILNLFLIYLMKRYGSNCAVTVNPQKLKYSQDFGFALEFVEENGLTPVEVSMTKLSEVRESLRECLRTNPPPVVIVPLVLKFVDAAGNDRGAHSNMLIVRTASKTVEHFEPHGAYFMNQVANGAVITRTLKNVLTALLPPSYKLVESHTVCPTRGLQTMEEKSTMLRNEQIDGGGYCAAWSAFFAEMCLRNPQLSSQQVFRQLLDALERQSGEELGKKANALHRIIRSYCQRMGKVLYQYFAVVLQHALPEQGNGLSADTILKRMVTETASMGKVRINLYTATNLIVRMEVLDMASRRKSGQSAVARMADQDELAAALTELRQDCLQLFESKALPDEQMLNKLGRAYFTQYDKAEPILGGKTKRNRKKTRKTT